MKKLIIPVMVLLFVLAAAAETTEHVKLKCKTCHKGVRKKKLSVSGEKICLNCHDIMEKSHPIHIKTEGEAKSDRLPLSNGQIVCYTCHDPHFKSEERSFLRMEFSKLCLECHKRHGH